MNSVERVHTALKRGQPDRVPVLEFGVAETVARAAGPGCRDVADGMARLARDGVGCGARFELVQRNADGSFVDAWGVTYLPGPEAVARPLRGPITTLEDARADTPPDPEALHRLGKLPDLVARYKGKRAICFHHRAAFMWPAYWRGLDSIHSSGNPQNFVAMVEAAKECGAYPLQLASSPPRTEPHNA